VSILDEASAMRAGSLPAQGPASVSAMIVLVMLERPPKRSWLRWVTVLPSTAMRGAE
jgi:hypothetical protein